MAAKCSQCGHSYTSRTHRTRCLGLSLAEHHARNRGRARPSRACSRPNMASILSGGRIVADGAFYSQPAEQPVLLEVAQ